MTVKTLSLSILFLIVSSLVWGQQNKTYVDKKGKTHLCGLFDLTVLESDTSYKTWYVKYYEAFEVKNSKAKWKKSLKDKEVDIYLGTWCGDSKTWVPRFVKLWDELGLDRNNLNFIGLYDGGDRYKQGPNHEENGKFIHRVPTFIIKEAGKEVARIVEYPRNDLETDLAQIALGVPSEPNYKAANYLMRLLDQHTVAEIKKDYKTHVNKVYKLQEGSSELNTLGYVFLHAGEVEKALLVFRMNMQCNKYVPNVYDSYAEALEKAGKKEQALIQYQKVLRLDPNNKNARAKVNALKADGVESNDIKLN